MGFKVTLVDIIDLRIFSIYLLDPCEISGEIFMRFISRIWSTSYYNAVEILGRSLNLARKVIG
jgi:hypothetical protein